MGVLELFGTLVKNDITSTAIKSNFSSKLSVNHLFLDFNSIIHVSSLKILANVNIFLQLVLRNIYAGRSVSNVTFTELFDKYGMQDIQKKITQTSKPTFVINLFHEHFTDKYMDKLIITLVINTVLYLVRTYCQNKTIQTLMIAIDGVPSKGKMVEQRQRRYLGAITEEYKKRILHKYKDYLLGQPDFVYLTTKHNIKWSRNKITPGTGFMHKMVNYLKSDVIMAKFMINRSSLKIIISDMYEIGEGEKKIVNYINLYLEDTKDTVMIYSPDGDVILLCLLLPVDNLYMLRYNQQESRNNDVCDLIDIRLFKNNISYYINNNPNFAKEAFDVDRINRDLVCVSTLFGNDFVPKIETINVKKGFQNIMDAYLRTLLMFKHKQYYLVKSKNDKGLYRLNLVFFRQIITELLPEENDFIKYNKLYAQYINAGQIKNAFNYMTINSENIVSTFNTFRKEYESLQHTIQQNGSLFHYEKHDHFMYALKKSIIIVFDGQIVNTTYLSNKDMLKMLQKYFYQTKKFPRLNINLNTWSHSITDPIHKKRVKEEGMNEYEKELYKFGKMLDEYYVKMNAAPLDLSRPKIPDFYKIYFDVDLYDKKGNLTDEASQVMYDYLEGTMWVFNYYFNDITYVNTWYYKHERAPLLNNFSSYLNTISIENFNKIYNELDKYQVKDLNTYFNPVEQLIYVSPMTKDIVELLPSNYQTFLNSDDMDIFLKNFFVDIKLLTKKLWQEKISCDVDCHSIVYLNKCLFKPITKPTASDDTKFLKLIRKVKHNTASKRRSQSTEPNY